MSVSSLKQTGRTSWNVLKGYGTVSVKWPYAFSSLTRYFYGEEGTHM